MNQPIKEQPNVSRSGGALQLKWKRYDMYETRPVRCITESTQDISHKANLPALPLGTERVKSVEECLSLIRRCASAFQF